MPRVCGMTDTLKLVASTRATVRLMPSMAIEPFSTTYARMFAGALTVYHTALSSWRTFAMVPTPSMCPETMCPPKRPFAAMARSRLTGLPRRNVPSEDRSRVSCITSAVNEMRVNEVTVRHVPFTAMLSPTCMSSMILKAWIVS